VQWQFSTCEATETTNHGTTTGMLIGIALGLFVVFAVVVVFVYFWWSQQKKKGSFAGIGGLLGARTDAPTSPTTQPTSPSTGLLSMFRRDTSQGANVAGISSDNSNMVLSASSLSTSPTMTRFARSGFDD
jgi:hypothetical protein